MTFRAVSARIPFREKDFLVLRVLNELESQQLVVTLTAASKAHATRGVLVLRGPVAIAEMMTLASEERSISRNLDNMDILSCTFERFRDLPESAKHIIRRAGARPNPDAVVPSIVAKQTGEAPRGCNPAEARLIHCVLRGLLLASERGWLSGDGLLRREGAAPALLVSGDPLSPELSVTLDIAGGATTTSEGPRPSMSLPRDRLIRLPRHQQCWLIGCPMVPLSLEGGGKICRLLLVVDRRSRRLIDGRPVFGERWDYAAAEAVLDIMTGGSAGDEGRGLPAQILFAEHELARLLCPELRLLGLACRQEPNVEGPVLEHMEKVVDWLCKAVPGFS